MKRLICVLLLVPLAGCYRPLFDDNLPRHQYQSYDAARNGAVPTEEYDLFGKPKPVLRARLSE